MPHLDDHSVFQGTHHARVHFPDVTYHVIARVLHGRMLLRPSKELNAVIAGVIGRAQSLHHGVRLFAFAFMSNHVHLMLRGEAQAIPAFIGYIKREVSRRWGPRVGWREAFWSRPYHSTALPTADSEVRCLKYVLSQGVKEGLVGAPEDWPGVHVAHQLIGGRPLRGRWLDGTAYAKARFCAQSARVRCVDQRDFEREYEVRVDRLPCWEGLSDAEVRRRLQAMRAEIVEEGRCSRAGKSPAGASRVCRVPTSERRSLEPPPWWEERRRLICWAPHSAAATRAYVARYWAKQKWFRAVSPRWCRADDGQVLEFPPGLFRPGRFECGRPTALLAA